MIKTGRIVTKGKASGVSPTEAMTKVSGTNWSPEGALVFVNGRKLEPDALKSFHIEYTREGMRMVLEINYEEKEEGGKSKAVTTTNTFNNKPSTKGISVMENKDPEVYNLQEEDVLKLQAMSALRTNKMEDGKLISKLHAPMPVNFAVEEKEIVTDSYDITAIAGISSALNDLAVQEQKIQRNPKVLRVEIIQKPKIVYVNSTFTFVEKFKLYKVEEKNEQ